MMGLCLPATILFGLLVGAKESAIPAGFPNHPGLQLLLTKPYLPADFDQETFDSAWQVWEEPLRTKAKNATPKERRKLAYARYGLDEVPGRDLPLQYTPDGKGGWVMNCFACHGGKVAGKLIPGAPNTHFALQTLINDTRRTKQKLGKKLTHMDIGSTFIPLGKSNGTTNAVIFGVALGSHRDEQLNLRPDQPLQKMDHHDHDAPAWWNVHHKTHLYADAFVPNDHRAIMQFLLVHENGPEKFREWEPDYEKIYDWIMNLPVPKYPFPIDEPLAQRGQAVFAKNCASCHGSYGPSGHYPHRVVSLEEVGTDPVRRHALPAALREGYSRNWLNYFGKGKHKVIIEPKGYLAPPLDGIWASAPYFHNGAVPTLWHLLHPADRPVVWKRTQMGYDQKLVGLEITTFTEIPAEAKSPSDKREFFDTRLHGKSEAGHLFPDKLNDAEKEALLEYLKTL